MTLDQIVYRRRRERLIPIAEKYANRVAGRSRKVSATPEVFADKWNRAFHMKMERLVKERRKAS